MIFLKSSIPVLCILLQITISLSHAYQIKGYCEGTNDTKITVKWDYLKHLNEKLDYSEPQGLYTINTVLPRDDQVIDKTQYFGWTFTDIVYEENPSQLLQLFHLQKDDIDLQIGFDPSIDSKQVTQGSIVTKNWFYAYGSSFDLTCYIQKIEDESSQRSQSIIDEFFTN